MSKVSTWVNAARLRTLPLSISGILVGTGMASLYVAINPLIFTLAILTTIGFQITSNFANDYGDGVKGTDSDERIGPRRVLQSGLLTPKKLKTGIYISILVDILLTVALIFVSFGLNQLLISISFLILGGFAIWAAVKYTVGKSAYGYNGLGDVFVFIFFGLVSVLGSMFLYTKSITFQAVLPAVSIGLLSVGVLNLNNLRDHVSDKKVGKNTLVVKMGYEKGKIYHYSLVIISFLCLILFFSATNGSIIRYVSLIGFLPMIFHMKTVASVEHAVQLDPELKKLALSTFLTALLFYVSYHYFL